MDYRGRKYYLIAAQWNCIDDIVFIIKNTFKYSKIHYLSSINIPNGYSKIMVGCKIYDSDNLFTLITTLEKLNSKGSYSFNKKKPMYIMQIKDSDLGQ